MTRVHWTLFGSIFALMILAFGAWFFTGSNPESNQVVAVPNEVSPEISAEADSFDSQSSQIMLGSKSENLEKTKPVEMAGKPSGGVPTILATTPEQISAANVGGLAEVPWQENPLPLIPLPSNQERTQQPSSSGTGSSLAWSRPSTRIASRHHHLVGFDWLDRGKKLVIAEGSRTGETKLSVREIATNSTLWEVWIPKGVTSLAVSPDETEIAVGSSDNHIALINSSDSTLRKILKGHIGDVRRMRYAGKGSQLVSLSYDRTAAIWDLKSGNLILRTRVHEQRPQNMGIGKQLTSTSPAGMRLLVCGPDGSMQWWTAGAEQFEPDTKFPKNNLIASITISRDGRFVLALDTDRNAILVDGLTGKKIGTISIPSPKTQSANQPVAVDQTSQSPDHNIGSGSRITQAVFSSDGSLLAGGSITGEIYLWSTNTQELKGILPGHTGLVSGLSFSPDNKRLVSTAYDGAMIVWDVSEAKEEKRVVPAAESIRDPLITQKSVISSDGRFSVLPRIDGKIDVVDSESLRNNRTLAGHSGQISSLAISENGERVVVGYEDGFLSIWNLKDLGSGAVEIEAAKTEIRALAIKSNVLIVGTLHGDLLEIDLSTGKTTESIHLSPNAIKEIFFNQTGTLAAVVVGDRELQLVRVPRYEQVHILAESKPLKGTEQKPVIKTIAFAPNKNRLAIGNSQGQVDLWDITESSDLVEAKLVGTVTLPRLSSSLNNTVLPDESQNASLTEISALRFTADGQHLLIASGRRIAVVGTVDTKIKSLLSTQFPAVTMTVRSDDSRLLAIDLMGGVQSWLPSILQKNRIAAHQGDAKFVLVTPDGKSIISGGTDKKVQVWDAKTGKQDSTFAGGVGVVTRGSVASAGDVLAICGYSSAVELWDIPQKKLITKRYGHSSKVVAVALSPDGKRVASAEENGPLLIRSLPSFKTEVTIPKQELPIIKIAWMPDGKQIITSTGDWKQWHLQGQIRIWDSETGKQVQQLTGSLGQSSCLLLTPDGRYLVTTSGDQMLRVWETNTWTVRAKIQHATSIRGATFFDSGRLLTCVLYPDTGFVLDTQTGKIRHRFRIPTSLVQDVSAAWNADWFVTSGMDGTLQIYQLPGSKGIE